MFEIRQRFDYIRLLYTSCEGNKLDNSVCTGYSRDKCGATGAYGLRGSKG